MDEDANQQEVKASQQIDYLVKQLSADLDKLNEQIREQRQMLKDAMQTDSSYQEISDKIKELSKQRLAIQKGLSVHDAVRKTKGELQKLNNQKKEMHSKLSEYLRQYVEVFNSNTLEDLEGNLKEIITQYKLVRHKRN